MVMTLFSIMMLVVLSYAAEALPRSTRQVMASKAADIAKITGWAIPVIAGMPASSSGRQGGSALRSSKTGRTTNEVLKVVDGIRHKRLGGSDIVVSEIGLGTQRWMGEDFNSPDEKICLDFLDRAILNSGVNLIDTAEQYPIPSSNSNPEGSTERVIGKWLAQGKGRREKVVIASKITGGKNVNIKNLEADCDGSLKRLGTDYLDVYMTHWPARYSPQSNWGQSLEYNMEAEPYYTQNANLEELVGGMGKLLKAGKIRSWGLCNDNCYGLTATHYIAKSMGVDPPVCLQNDYSLTNRRVEESGQSEASSPFNLNTGFMAYNLLGGGFLTGKYLNGPPSTADNPNMASSLITRAKPRGRHDSGWGSTLYRYRSGPAAEALQQYKKIADKNKVTMTELSLLWARQRDYVTTSLVGCSSMEQLETDIKIYKDSCKYSKSGLPESVMWEIDRIHMMNRNPIFASTRAGKDWNNEGEIGERIP